MPDEAIVFSGNFYFNEVGIKLGRLIFDDRVSKTTVEKYNENGITTTITNTSSVPGETKGRINDFSIFLAITMDGLVVSDEDLKLTISHEGGHSAGLNLPWQLTPEEIKFMPQLNQLSENADIILIKENFMNSSENISDKYRSNGGPNILFNQLFFIFNNVKKESFFTKEDLEN